MFHLGITGVTYSTSKEILGKLFVTQYINLGCWRTWYCGVQAPLSARQPCLVHGRHCVRSESILEIPGPKCGNTYLIIIDERLVGTIQLFLMINYEISADAQRYIMTSLSGMSVFSTFLNIWRRFWQLPFGFGHVHRPWTCRKDRPSNKRERRGENLDDSECSDFILVRSKGVLLFYICEGW